MLIFEQCLRSQCAPACEGMSCVSAPSSRPPSSLPAPARRTEMAADCRSSSLLTPQSRYEMPRGAAVEASGWRSHLCLGACVFFAVVQVWLCILFCFFTLDKHDT